jgi:hypothetical protein
VIRPPKKKLGIVDAIGSTATSFAYFGWKRKEEGYSPQRTQRKGKGSTQEGGIKPPLHDAEGRRVIC